MLFIVVDVRIPCKAFLFYTVEYSSAFTDSNFYCFSFLHLESFFLFPKEHIIVMSFNVGLLMNSLSLYLFGNVFILLSCFQRVCLLSIYRMLGFSFSTLKMSLHLLLVTL